MGVVRRAIHNLIRSLLRTGAIVAILAVNEEVVGLRFLGFHFQHHQCSYRLSYY